MQKWNEFDERQLQTRNAVFKYGLVFLSVYVFTDAVLKQSGIVWADSMSSAWIGIMAMVCLCSTLLILRNAYTTSNPILWNISVTVMSIGAALSLPLGILDIQKVGFISQGHITFAARTFIIGVFFLIITVTYWSKKIMDRKESAGAEE